MNIIDLDRKFIWHPFTQEKTAGNPIAITKGEGSYVYDEDGNAYLDMISSWWVNLHGHSNPEIADAIYKQAMQLEHVLFAGFTHEPAVKLCEALSKIIDPILSKYFYSDNGSTAVEVALKMAHQYWYNKGEKRSRFISFEGAYHGDTFGAMSVGRSSGFHEPFKQLMFDIFMLPYPDTWLDDDTYELREVQILAKLRKELEVNGSTFTALILEPIVQGASGMRICRPQFIKQVIDEVRKHEILVIFDEVMTGFGRTGSYFAYEQLDLVPDFLCISKGITGGFLPLAITLTTQKVYDAFYSEDWSKTFTHGHSYTANPIACAAAIKSLEILQRREAQDNIKIIEKVHRQEMNKLYAKHNGMISKARMHGTIAAFDVHSKIDKSLFNKHGLLVRPLGRSVYFIPPYCITSDELKSCYQKLSIILEKSIL